ncbi:MAG: signal peptidase I [Candidatus Pelagibacter sp. TMED118]|nr:MAG: signal peptidase I [Candidatus Pelagibacter sp. TMED118]
MKWFIENLKTLLYALIIAVIIRSLLIQPFYIPSSSMEPNLLVGDRLFVTKASYGYSKHSFPFSPPIFKGRLLPEIPSRGDVIVFKTPADNRTDYIKRLIGLPGDTIQFIEGDIYINNEQLFKTIQKKNHEIYCGQFKIKVNTFLEKLPDGTEYLASYRSDYTYNNSMKFIVPDNKYFFLGDNRDCSKDSRFLDEVGYVHADNLVGKAQILFFSSDPRVSSILNVFKWNKSLRIKRFFSKIK